MFVVKTDRYRMLKDDIKITDGTSKILYARLKHVKSSHVSRLGKQILKVSCMDVCQYDNQT